MIKCFQINKIIEIHKIMIKCIKKINKKIFPFQSNKNQQLSKILNLMNLNLIYLCNNNLNKIQNNKENYKLWTNKNFILKVFLIKFVTNKSIKC